jgi:hypothetical protein
LSLSEDKTVLVKQKLKSKSEKEFYPEKTKDLELN